MSDPTSKTTDLPIETAPKDGTPVRVKRIYKGMLIYDGWACWRTVHFPELPADPLGRCGADPAFSETGWMCLPSVAEKQVPEPTHWVSE